MQNDGTQDKSTTQHTSALPAAPCPPAASPSSSSSATSPPPPSPFNLRGPACSGRKVGTSGPADGAPHRSAPSPSAPSSAAIPPQVYAIAPECNLHAYLLDFERRLDIAVSRAESRASDCARARVAAALALRGAGGSPSASGAAARSESAKSHQSIFSVFPNPRSFGGNKPVKHNAFIRVTYWFSASTAASNTSSTSTDTPTCTDNQQHLQFFADDKQLPSLKVITDQPSPLEWTIRVDTVPVDNTPASPRHTLGNLVQQVTLLLDQSLFPMEDAIEWSHRTGSLKCDSESVGITRMCPTVDLEGHTPASFDCRLAVLPNHCPELFRPDEHLLQLIQNRGESNLIESFDALSQADVLLFVWRYVRDRGLIPPGGEKLVVCPGQDKLAAAVFDTPHEFPLSEMAARVARHLIPHSPTQFTFRVEPSANPVTHTFNFTVQVDEASASGPAVSDEDQKFWWRKGAVDTSEIDRRIEEKIEVIQEHLNRRELLLAFSLDPVRFLNHLVDAHTRDCISPGSDPDATRRASYYTKNPLLSLAIDTYLNQQQQPHIQIPSNSL
ncbi:SWI/SNF-related matrix-associated actin-dependent regulator of chromatin subfamily D [Pelomyxa schiedti]|nr:SWI/SNF-related matrix-associated actin-dependent regulator of chromatin subfamily D [Pelomyxa schiedti]